MLEASAREEIRLRSCNVIQGISEDLRTMWGVLHPERGISEVSLYVPRDADKAIDIRLRFHGKAQDSPRLTLSEGYRNSLGLCIFLAMAKQERKHDCPIFLDDVFVSLDRNHRGMIGGLLEREFGDRQVVLLTHDREWFAELRHQLDPKRWTFRALLPYETPQVGIRWSDNTKTFDNARAHLEDRPGAAANDARKIMDVELAIIAERLRIRLPYRRGHQNDLRTAHEFLERIISDAKKRFQVKKNGHCGAHEKALDAFRVADDLLVSWGNRGSHSFDVVRGEAQKLINACETALAMFTCRSCGKEVWFAKSSRWVQCECGALRW